MSKKVLNNVMWNVLDLFVMLRYYVEVYLKLFIINKKMVDYIIFFMVGLFVFFVVFEDIVWVFFM